MTLKVIGFASVGPAQVIAEDRERRSSADEIARITIPDGDLPDVVAVLLVRAFQQNLWSDDLKEAVRFAQEVIPNMTSPEEILKRAKGMMQMAILACPTGPQRELLTHANLALEGEFQGQGTISRQARHKRRKRDEG